MKTFLLFVALVCATTTAIPTPTNVNGESLSAFLTNLKQGLENLLGLVQRFEMEQSTQIDQTTTTTESTMANDQSIPRILVVTGYGDGGSTKKTELWPKPESQCALADFPLEVVGAVGFWTAQGPMVCGGYKENRCFLYKNHQWMPSTTMQTVRSAASAIQMTPNQAIVIGGYYGNGNRLKTTELMTSTGSEEGEDFPVKMYGHCSFKINGSLAMVTGGIQGWSYSASTWFVDLTTKTVTPGPKMTARSGHGCSTLQIGTKTFGIVAGGYTFNERQLDSTEIINLEEDSPTWTEGPKLPRRLTSLTLVETTHGTYALGGDSNGSRSEVYKLDCPGNQIQSCQWQEMDEKLEVGRDRHVSLSLPESYDICN